ncbi:MAG: hypothetical protein JW811_01470 [Clostridiales bacterium]|nr:hypothetical protein [Clostridiales bacterium]
MKKSLKMLSAVTALILLLMACGVPAAAESAGDVVNLLILASEDMGNSYFPIMPMILSLNLKTLDARLINFYFQTQIFAVAKNGEEISVPMSLLPNCEVSEIVKAYENTFGIPIDRYLIYVYQYGSYSPIVDVFDMMFPITLDIPEEILGTAQYTTINGNMKSIANTLKRQYSPIEQAGPHELDAVGYLAYYCAIPDYVWGSGDRLSNTLEDYKYWDMKNEAVIEAFRPIIGLMSPDTVAMLIRMLVSGQLTDITEDDIVLWSTAGLNFAADSPYLTVPGFEGVELQGGNIGSLKGISAYQNMMLTYDNEAVKQQIQAFLYGE